MKIIALLIVMSLSYACTSISNEEVEKNTILSVLNVQKEAWSNNDIDGFMEGYWKNDSLKFYGANGLTYGWENTLANYKKRYPSKDHSGKLNFKINDISKIDKDSYFVMGEYFLHRPIGDANGIFMIILKR